MNFSIDAASAINIAQIALSKTQDEFLQIVKDMSSGELSSMDPSDIYVSDNIDKDTSSRYQSIENAQQGINVTQVADGSLSEVSGMLNRILELSMQASSDIYSDTQRQAMQAEVNQLTEQITKSLGNTTYNGKNLINMVTSDGKEIANIDFQVGANSLPSSLISYNPNIKLDEMNFDLSSSSSAQDSMKLAEKMLEAVGTKRSEIASVQTELLNSVESNMTAIINNEASSSSIKDTNYAASMVGLLQNQIKQESLVAVLSSTFKSQSSILNLISGIPA